LELKFTIRKAGVADIDRLTELLEQLFAIEVDFTPEPQKQLRGLELMLADERNRCIMVAENGTAVVGMCSAQLVISTAEGALSGWIEDMVIDAGFRGAGIGRSLLAAVETWCYQQGATRVQLLAERENTPALEFYRKNGWQATQLSAWRKHRGDWSAKEYRV
jgi:GNAT superfamily N-acetyltransferase